MDSLGHYLNSKMRLSFKRKTKNLNDDSNEIKTLRFLK